VLSTGAGRQGRDGWAEARLVAVAGLALLLVCWPAERATAGRAAGTQRSAVAAATIPPVSLPAIRRGGALYLHFSQTTGAAESQFLYGNPSDTALMCDWSGNGTRTPAVFRGGAWYVRNSNSSGGGDVAFSFGSPGDIPVCGDWTGNGHDSPGVFRNGIWYLRNSLTTGYANLAFAYGSPGDRPVVGRWITSSVATPGVVRNGRWYLRTSNSSGNADITPFAYGNPGDVPVVGDWTNAGHDSPGVFRSGLWYLRNSTTTGFADIAFAFGSPGDVPLTWYTGRPPPAPAFLWGIDTIDNVQTANDIAMTNDDLGSPSLVGRYLIFERGQSIASTEVQYIHSLNLKILLIVDQANRNLLGATVAVAEAQAAIAAAQNLGVPAGTALFRDVETNSPIDPAYVTAWYSTVLASGYVPAFYENPLNGPFSANYCAAVAQNAAIGTGTFLWSSEPEQQGSDPHQSARPSWAPSQPPCQSTTVAWQYLIRSLFPANLPAPNVDVDQYWASFSRLLW
jgi:hypothetical protein